MTKEEDKHWHTDNLEANFIEKYSIKEQERVALLMSEVASYCARGWAVHPLGNKKRPLLKGWRYKATTNLEIFMEWINEWSWANVGIVTGFVSNLLVLDVDGLNGIKSLQSLNFPKSPTVVTARGHHYYFKFPLELHNIPTTRAGLLPGIDTRGNGGYIIAPPSIHESGHLYHWKEPLIGELPRPPDWLIKCLTPPVKAFYKKPTVNFGKKGSNYSFIALKQESEAVAMAAVGMRNSRLNQAAFSMGTLVAAGAISIEFVADHLALAAMRAGLTCSEIEKTLHSWLAAGMKQPREVHHG